MKEISEGEKIKWGYGICWLNYNRMTYTIFPVPFNIALRFLRRIYFYLVKPARTKFESDVSERVAGMYDIGFERGNKQGKQKAISEWYRFAMEEKGIEELIAKWKKDGFYIGCPSLKD